MSNYELKYGLVLFKRLYENLPPLTPNEVKERLEKILNYGRNSEGNDLNNAYIIFGKYLWPFNKAFGDFYSEYKAKIGEKFLVDKMNNPLKRKYLEERETGNDFFDIYVGRNAGNFNFEERHQLREHFSQAERDLKKFIKQAILSTRLDEYKKLIKTYQQKLREIEVILESLKAFALNSREILPSLSEEIMSKIVYFEHGLSELSVGFNYNEIFQAENYFNERKAEKNFFKTKI